MSDLPDYFRYWGKAFPDMRAFVAAWTDRRIVQEVFAQITWYHNIGSLEKLDDAETRLWYARKARENGWSHIAIFIAAEKVIIAI